MGVSDHKCLACKARLKFNPKKQKWVCEYCESEYTLDDLENDIGEKINTNSSKCNEYKEYHCPDCGAQIIMDENTAATECAYCGNTAIITERFEEKFKPNGVIPFKKSKEEVRDAFYNYKKGKLFMPKEFIKKENIEKIYGIYIPFHLYSMKVWGGITVEAQNVTEWSNGGVKYEKTDFYKVVREGNFNFEKIPTDASKKFRDDIMDSIEPYNYEEMVKFNSSYMSGFLAEKYDLNSDELLERASNRAKQTARDVLYADIVGYRHKRIKSSVESVEQIKNTEYVLLPAWMMNVKFNNNIYTLAMNGQTGKFIGNVPISKIKVAKFWMGLFAALTAIITLILALFEKERSFISNFAVAAGLAIIISTISCVIVGIKHKPVKVAKTAANYLEKDKNEITRREDIFVTSTVKRK